MRGVCGRGRNGSKTVGVLLKDPSVQSVRLHTSPSTVLYELIVVEEQKGVRDKSAHHARQASGVRLPPPRSTLCRCSSRGPLPEMGSGGGQGTGQGAPHRAGRAGRATRVACGTVMTHEGGCRAAIKHHPGTRTRMHDGYCSSHVYTCQVVRVQLIHDTTVRGVTRYTDTDLQHLCLGWVARMLSYTLRLSELRSPSSSCARDATTPLLQGTIVGWRSSPEAELVLDAARGRAGYAVLRCKVVVLGVQRYGRVRWAGVVVDG